RPTQERWLGTVFLVIYGITARASTSRDIAGRAIRSSAATFPIRITAASDIDGTLRTPGAKIMHHVVKHIIPFMTGVQSIMHSAFETVPPFAERKMAGRIRQTDWIVPAIGIPIQSLRIIRSLNDRIR